MSIQKKKEEVPFYERYLTMEALEDELSVTFDAECEYCVDGDGNWKVLPAYGFVYINKGQFLCFRGNLIPSDYGIGTFETFEKFNLKGNVMSMLFGDYGKENSSLAGYDYAFSYLFSSCRKLQSVSPDFLPATTLSKGCYSGMFFGCNSLKDAPNLPATTLVEECYKYMFRECSQLASQITLPAEHLKPYCYTGMFYNCRLIDYIKALFVDVPSSDYTEGWVSNVSPSGTFVKNSNATWNVVGINGVPEGWTVKFDGEEDEEPTFEFPVYLNFDYCEEYSFFKYCERAADELSISLGQYLRNVVENHKVVDSAGYYTVSEDVLKGLGVEIYIEGELVKSLYGEEGSYSSENVFLVTDGEYSYTWLTKDGFLIYDY